LFASENEVPGLDGGGEDVDLHVGGAAIHVDLEHLAGKAASAAEGRGADEL
jgi:hypothetical protein